MKVFDKENNVIDVTPKKNLGKFIGVGIAVFFIALVLINSIKIIPAGKTGVVMTMGKVSDNVMQEGLNFKIPFFQTVAVINNKICVVEVDAAAVSKDLQSVSSKIAVNYRIAYNSSASLYKNIGNDYQNVILLPAVQESMKSISARYTAEELITKRNQVGEEIKELLESKVSEYGFVIEKFNIVNFDFSVEFNTAIEAKQVAEQNLIKTKTEQEQAIVVAEAEAKKKVIAAEAEAEAITKKAEAQAKANERLNSSLSNTIVEYEKVQKWDGKLPQATGSSSIIDMRTSN
ncbi:MAG: prohibitin family protein [Clostridiales bacterium]|nr:prohibitin family protein [Clostridiales bacterium]